MAKKTGKSSTPPLSDRALNRATLARQMLLRREKATPVAVVERLAGMQAQLARPPFVGIWSRIQSFQAGDLVKAVDRRDIVRGTLMRGTLHLVSRKDYLTFRAVLQPVLTAGMQAILRERAVALDIDGLVGAARAYFGEEARTFAELRAHLIQRFPKADERAMGYAVRMHLPLVQTPQAGSPWAYPASSDFAVAEAWLGAALKEPDPAAMAMRFLAAFGPARPDDLKTWAGVANAREIFESLRPQLAVFTDERGREIFDLPMAPRPGDDEPAPVRFLPEFDSVLLAYADRTRVIAKEHRPHIASKNLFVPATFLVDGMASGTWRVERKRKSAALVFQPFVPIGKTARAELEEEGEALLRFMEPDAVAFSVVWPSKTGIRPRKSP
jgi:DNA glycosylase AlkZ-like